MAAGHLKGSPTVPRHGPAHSVQLSCAEQGWIFSLSTGLDPRATNMIYTHSFPQRVPILVRGKALCLKISHSYLIKLTQGNRCFG